VCVCVYEYIYHWNFSIYLILPATLRPEVYSAFNKNVPEAEKNCFWVKLGWRVWLPTLPLSVSRLFRQCGIPNISQSYRPPRPVTGIALLYFFMLYYSVSHLFLAVPPSVISYDRGTSFIHHEALRLRSLCSSKLSDSIMYGQVKVLKLNSVSWVRERTVPIERPPLVGGVSANFCG
jgi:hypothetical protein